MLTSEWWDKATPAEREELLNREYGFTSTSFSWEKAWSDLSRFEQDTLVILLYNRIK